MDSISKYEARFILNREHLRSNKIYAIDLRNIEAIFIDTKREIFGTLKKNCVISKYEVTLYQDVTVL